MRVAVVTVQVPFISGGAEFLADGLVTHLRRRGVEAELVTLPFKWYPPKSVLDAMLAARLTDLEEVDGHSIDRLITLKFPAYYVPHSNKVLWLLHQHRQAYDLYDSPYGDLKETAFGRDVEQAFVVARSRVFQRALLTGFAIFLLMGGMVGMMWSGGVDVIEGRMTGGELGAFVFYAIMVGTAFATLSEVWGDLQRAAGAAERLMELLAETSEIPDTGSQTPASRTALAFEGVHFAYPSRPTHPALCDFTLEIAHGESVALVGPSGAGKSTVFELMLRFYDPIAGAIRFGGVDLRDMALDSWRQKIALVPQQPTLFSGDIFYNIAYGATEPTQAAVEDAAQMAHAHEFIQTLPEGYQSHLGAQGVRLSGGQRQRIALARAILSDPELLLLDEATSALDTESEWHVQQALTEIMRERTTIIIAHRLSTVINADRIVVMDEGQVIDSGPHDELMKRCELYQRLARLQFQTESAS